MEKSRCVPTMLVLVVLGAGACGEEGLRDAVTVPWSLNPSVLEAGAGIPFCDEAMARVAAFMGPFEGREPPSDRYGGTAVVGQPGEMGGGMNAHIVFQLQSQQHQMFVNLMTLVRYDSELHTVAYLAESWDESPDGTELTFHLRDDVFWHDGELTDAYDVAYTIERATDPETGFPNPGWWTYVDTGPGAVEVIDPLTVRVRMTPHADFMDLWTMLAIMPQHLLEDVPAAELATHPYGSVCPVGNGPFIFVEHRQNASWTFQANPAFPAGLGGRPFLDRYVYQIVIDQTTLLTALLTENIDLYVSPAPDQVGAILASDAVELSHFPGRSIALVAWNSRRPQLADKRVRMAITKGIDREEIVDALLGGYGVVANGTVPAFHPFYDASLGADVMAYDPEAARALLDEAGWMDQDGDGVRENAEGVRLSLSIKYHPLQLRQSIAEFLQNRLLDIGIEAVPTPLDGPSILSHQLSSAGSRDFDGVMTTWITDFRLDDTSLFHSDEIDSPFAWSGTRRPEIDELLERLPLIVDPDVAETATDALQELLVDEQPFTFLYQLERLEGLNKRIRGAVLDVRGEWVNLKDWWIPSAERKRYAW